LVTVIDIGTRPLEAAFNGLDIEQRGIKKLVAIWNLPALLAID
jgi:hypothetical protein